MINIIGGLIPTFIWLIIIYFFYSKEIKKNYKELLVCLILGALGSYICYRLEMHFGSYFKKVAISNYWEILFYAIFGVAIFEEGYKWTINILAPNIGNKTDILLISLITALGFATFENIVYYAIPYGFIAGIKRVYSAYLSHLICATWMGYLINKKPSNIINKLNSLLIPVLLHALYNSFLYGGKYRNLFPYCYVLILILTLFKIIRENKTKID